MIYYIIDENGNILYFNEDGFIGSGPDIFNDAELLLNIRSPYQYI